MQLIFVYNADSGMVNTVKDIGHKLFSPQTYDCFLCSLTHGAFREHPQWRAFREEARVEMVFLHRDEFEQKHQTTMEYPVVLRKTEDLEVVISRKKLENMSSIDELIAAVSNVEKNT